MKSFKDIWFISNQQQGQPIQWLDGDTDEETVDVQPSIMTAPADCDLTGTMWRLTKTGSNYLLRCLGADDPGQFYLDGNTGSGDVQLTGDLGNSGTQWKFIPQGDGYNIACQGTGGGEYQNLALIDGQVQLATKSTPVNVGPVIWYVYQLIPAAPLKA